MTHPTPNDEANARILAKIRNPDIKSREVLRVEALKLLASYSAEGCAKQVHFFREQEIAKWTGIEWRASPRMTQREAKLAGMERCAKEAPWLFAAGALEITPDVPPGPATLAPAHHVDNNKSRVVDVKRDASAKSPAVTVIRSGGYEVTRVATDDDALLESAREMVRKDEPALSGQAFHHRVTEMFHAMRNGQRDAALRGATIPKQPAPRPVPVKGGAR